MKNKLCYVLLTILLVGCNSSNNKSTSSSSERNTNSALICSSSFSTTFSINSSTISSINSSTSSNGSSSTSSFSNNSSSTSSNSSSVSTFISDKEFNLSDAYNSLSLAMLNDEDYNAITISKYSIREKYYQTQYYVMNSYSNDITIYSGTTTQTYYNDYSNKLISNFKEQRVYSDGAYTQIRKFNDIFTNNAVRYEMDYEDTYLYFNIGQSFNAYQVLSTFANNYNGVFEGEILEDGTRHGTYFYQTEASDLGYAFTAVLEISIDKDFYLTDFYYSEGYFDSYTSYDAESARDHGPLSYDGDGYTYEVIRSVKGDKTEYTLDLPFKIEDNFISSLSFNDTEITLKMSDFELNYINLIDYITANIDIGFTSGAPINNLQFTSSNPSVITIGDQYYADFKGVGETEITVFDSAYGVSGSNTMKIILEE